MPSRPRASSARRARRPAGPRHPGSPARPFGAASTLGLALLGVAVLAGFLILRSRPPERASSRVSHPSAALGAEEATRLGLSLARAGDPLEAIPYFRHVTQRAPNFWGGHLNLASALHNGAQQARLHLGKEEIATRSSIERAGMVREAIQELETALARCPTSRERATVLAEWGRTFYTWGFPNDALALYRRAASEDPAQGALNETLRRLEAELEDGA